MTFSKMQYTMTERERELLQYSLVISAVAFHVVRMSVGPPVRPIVCFDAIPDVLSRHPLMVCGSTSIASYLVAFYYSPASILDCTIILLWSMDHRTQHASQIPPNQTSPSVPYCWNRYNGVNIVCTCGKLFVPNKGNTRTSRNIFVPYRTNASH